MSDIALDLLTGGLVCRMLCMGAVNQPDSDSSAQGLTCKAK